MEDDFEMPAAEEMMNDEEMDDFGDDEATLMKVGDEKEIGQQGLNEKLLKEGDSWETLDNEDEVEVRYEAHLEDGVLVGKSDGVEFTVSEGHFCPALSKAVKTMKKGEKVLLTMKPQYGFEEQGKPSFGDGAVVPPNATLDMNTEKKIEAAGKNEEEKSMDVKTLHSIAQGSILLGDLESAESYIKKALDIDPNNREVILEFKSLKDRKNKKVRKYKTLKKKMRKYNLEERMKTYIALEKEMRKYSKKDAQSYWKTFLKMTSKLSSLYQGRLKANHCAKA